MILSFSILLLQEVVYSQITLSYDKSGNRIDKTVATFKNHVFVSPIKGNSYQWQQNTGNGFQNINNSNIFSGSQNAALVIDHAPTNWAGYLFRCVVNTSGGIVTTSPDTLSFNAQWQGNTSTAWNIASNWCCGIVPDSNTRVLIPAVAIFYPVVNIPVKILSLKMDSASKLSISSGVNFTIKK